MKLQVLEKSSSNPYVLHVKQPSACPSLVQGLFNRTKRFTKLSSQNWGAAEREYRVLTVLVPFIPPLSHTQLPWVQVTHPLERKCSREVALASFCPLAMSNDALVTGEGWRRPISKIWLKQTAVPRLGREREAANPQSTRQSVRYGKEAVKKYDPAVFCISGIAVYLN